MIVRVNVVLNRTVVENYVKKLELCVVFFVMFFFVMGVRICFGIGSGSPQFSCNDVTKCLLRSLGKLDIYITLPLERERIVSNLYYIFYSFYVTVTLLSFVYNSEVL